MRPPWDLQPASILSRVISIGCFSIVTPYGWSTGQNVALYWSADPTDAEQFSIKLFNPGLLQEPLTIVASVAASQDFFTFVMPPVTPG
jgi:hypothetical protein